MFQLFISAVLPPALLMLALLLLPLPPKVAKSVITLCDAVLFSLPHPNVPLSLFWIVFGLSAATFLIFLDDS